jgi:MFS family permease
MTGGLDRRRPGRTAEASAGLQAWSSPAVVALAVTLASAGFGQFSVVATLGDVAEAFGETTRSPTLAEQAGLSGTVLGIGLAITRLASLASLPLAGVADRVGRRPTIVGYCLTGLALTTVAAASPNYWACIAAFAVARPFLLATDTVAEVAAAEQTPSQDRTKALALLAAGYGAGSGAVTLVHGAVGGVLGFRGVLVLTLVPLALTAVVARWVSEPSRYRSLGHDHRPLPVRGAMERRFRRRLLVLVVLVFAVSAITGPANTFAFLYSENVLGLSALATAAIVVAGGVLGLLGLLAGRWAADTAGRRLTAGLSMGALAIMAVASYSGSIPALAAAYPAGLAAGGAFAPAMGALAAELFPTEVRATVAGWMVGAGVLGASAGLLAFGALADITGAFGQAALAVFIPAGALALLVALLPETRGRELEDWSSD